jgi:hypothetical protein
MEYILIQNILEHTNVKTHIKMLQISNKINQMTKDVMMQKVTMLKCSSSKKIQDVMKYFKFKHVNVNYSYIQDNDVEYLKDCTSVNLIWCPHITNNCLKYLSNCNIVRLDMTHITNLKPLEKCKSLTLSYCQNIPSDEFKNLKNIHDIDVSYTNIMDYNIFSQCHSLIIEGNIVDDSMIDSLKNKYYLGITGIESQNCNIENIISDKYQNIILGSIAKF